MKNLMNLGKALNKAEQKNVYGGHRPPSFTKECSPNCECETHNECANMPNPDWNLGSFIPTGQINQNGSPFVQGACVNGKCVV